MSAVELNYASQLPRRQEPSRWLYFYACFMVAATLGLIAAGGMITSTGSGLSVPDWPTTYGENMFTFPFSKWTGGIFYEHSHRLIASTVGFLTIILAIWLHIARPSRFLKVLGWCALAAVIVQGVLGGLTVIYLLPTWISVMHGCVAQSFLCILVTIAVKLGIMRRADSVGGRAGSPFAPSGSTSPRLALLLAMVVFGQLIAGAIMRHTESGLAIPDFPAMYGSYTPSLSADALARYNESRAFDYGLEPVTRTQVMFHLAHRGGAVLVVALMLIAAWRFRTKATGDFRLGRAVGLIAVLVLVQAGLGIATVLLRKPPLIATAHVVVGAATLAACWRLFLYAQWLPVRSTVISASSVMATGPSAAPTNPKPRIANDHLAGAAG